MNIGQDSPKLLRHYTPGLFILGIPVEASDDGLTLDTLKHTERTAQAVNSRPVGPGHPDSFSMHLFYQEELSLKVNRSRQGRSTLDPENHWQHFGIAPVQIEGPSFFGSATWHYVQVLYRRILKLRLTSYEAV